MSTRNFLTTLVLISLPILGGLVYWGFQPEGVPTDTLYSTGAVEVTYPPEATRFRPRAPQNNAGLIFLPDAMVSPAAYTPMLKRIANAGHHAVLENLPARCACLEPQINSLFSRIQAFIAAHPETRWHIGGHGRGGMLAARYVRESPATIAGLILVATPHPLDFDISTLTIPVTKIYGSNDGVAPAESIRAGQKLLPPSTTWVEIPGANHAQFAHYHFHPFDREASITRDAQQSTLLKSIKLGNAIH